MLYIVATPIGNLEDLSIRQAKLISSADILLSEDTRSSGLLLLQIEKLFNYKQNPKLRHVSYYKETEFQKLPMVLSELESGKQVVLISSAGMPIISDPGSLLVKQVIKKSIPYTIIPGPTAYTTALVHSGFETGTHMFVGFFPKKTSELAKLLKQFTTIKSINPETVFIAYESPNRINKTLETISTYLPNTDLVICRELTKKFEEIIRGKAKDLMQRPFKGELVILLS